MSKYAPLADFLAARDAAEVPMSFAEIEQVIGGPLPASKRHPAWWSNNPHNNVMTRVWLEAGFVTERVDPARERVVFRRAKPARGTTLSARAPATETTSPQAVGLYSRGLAALGGTVTIAEGVDITAPTGEVWDAEVV